MSGDIKKTISELHIYEKKLLKELETNPDATPEEIAKNTQMDMQMGDFQNVKSLKYCLPKKK